MALNLMLGLSDNSLAKLNEWCAQTGHKLVWSERQLTDPPVEIQWEALLYHGEKCLLTAVGRNKKQAKLLVAQKFMSNPEVYFPILPKLTSRPKEDLSQLKALTITNDSSQVNAWCSDHKAMSFGLDCEFYQGHLATIQLATYTAGLVYAVGDSFPENLKRLLENPIITKYIVDPTQDREVLAKDAKIQLKGEVDVRALVPKTYVQTMGMDKLCELFLHIPPKDSLATSNWLDWPLSARQVNYAVTDAIRSLQLGHVLSQTQVEPEG